MDNVEQMNMFLVLLYMLLRWSKSLRQWRCTVLFVCLMQDESLDAFWVVNRGDVDVTYHDGENGDSGEFQLPRASLEWTGERCGFIEDADGHGRGHGREMRQVKWFGEWVLARSLAKSITVVATSDVECWYITREAFEGAVGPLSLILKEDER